MTTDTPTADIIRPALESVYGESGTVTSLAVYLASEWPHYEQEADEGYRTVEKLVHLTIWNWFPGGETAALAAERVVAAVNGDACPKGGEHHWKFNGGNPVCLKCNNYRNGYVRRVFPATVHDDGTVEVHVDD